MVDDAEAKDQSKAFQRRMAAAVFFIIMAGTLIILVNITSGFGNRYIENLLFFVAGSILFFSLAYLLWLYLMFAPETKTKFGGAKYIYRSDDAEILETIRQEINTIKHSVRNVSEGSIGISSEDRLELVALIKETLYRDLSDAFLKAIESKYAISVITSHEQSTLFQRFDHTRDRLSFEIAALTRRGNINLAIGGATTLFAIGILAYIVLSAQISTVDAISLTAYYVPRLSLVIFIEIFSYFFLKLYRSSLSEIKYFQNEMTNIEAKFISLLGALIADDKEATRAIVAELSKTERNFILTKDQTTVDLEKLKLDNDMLQDIAGKVTALLKKSKD